MGSRKSSGLGRLIGPTRRRRGITQPLPTVTGDPGPFPVLCVPSGGVPSPPRRATAATDGAAATGHGKPDTQKMTFNRRVGSSPREKLPEIGTTRRGRRAHRGACATRAPHPPRSGRGHRESLIPRAPAAP